MKTNDPDYWIKKLNLTPHPEGGYFIETYRNSMKFNDRNLATSIYFLLKGSQISKFHRLSSDEIWYHNYGSSILIYMLCSDGRLETVKLGNDIANGDNLSVIIKAGIIFAAEISDKNSFSMVSCAVIPGFSFSDFKLFKTDELTDKYPVHKKIIKKFT